VVYVSATPADYELRMSGGVIVEQIIRPTGLTDPEILLRPASGQVDDLLHEVRQRVQRQERVLVTTLTKRMAEELTDYYRTLGIRVVYLHSDIHTLQRSEIIRELRLGTYDVLVGVNLLREGLDLPEVSLVAILDADKEGFLRSERSLIQTIGRAARHINGQVLMYADHMTGSLERAMGETNRRRELQQHYNEEHGITPAGIVKDVRDALAAIYDADYVTTPVAAEAPVMYDVADDDIPRLISKLRKDMKAAAERYEFERAAALRDRIMALQERELELR
jgi:excinuclease ABC subunit B